LGGARALDQLTRSVRIRLADFEAGALPAVCVASGASPDRSFRVRLRTVSGYLPYADGVQRRLRRRRVVWLVLAALGVVVGVFGWSLAETYAFRGWAVALVGLGVALLTVFGYLAADPPGVVQVRLDRSSGEVVLTGVSAAFADAYEAR
jgi:hypothetical protein